jgi:hypothetical protein
MAVPGSGTLSMLNIAQEALYGTWGSGTITGPISLYDVVNGGNTNGSGNSYPTVNTNCTPNPADRTALTLTNVTEACGGGSTTFYYNSSIGNASNLNVGDYLYTNSSLTTAVAADYYYQTGSTATTTVCSDGAFMSVAVGSNGVITSIVCQSL